MEEAVQVSKQKHSVTFLTLNPSADGLLDDNK